MGEGGREAKRGVIEPCRKGGQRRKGQLQDLRLQPERNRGRVLALAPLRGQRVPSQEAVGGKGTGRGVFEEMLGDAEGRAVEAAGREGVRLEPVEEDTELVRGKDVLEVKLAPGLALQVGEVVEGVELGRVEPEAGVVRDVRIEYLYELRVVEPLGQNFLCPWVERCQTRIM